jgi:hypothetical protein
MAEQVEAYALVAGSHSLSQ